MHPTRPLTQIHLRLFEYDASLLRGTGAGGPSGMMRETAWAMQVLRPDAFLALSLAFLLCSGRAAPGRCGGTRDLPDEASLASLASRLASHHPDSVCTGFISGTGALACQLLTDGPSDVGAFGEQGLLRVNEIQVPGLPKRKKNPPPPATKKPLEHLIRISKRLTSNCWKKIQEFGRKSKTGRQPKKTSLHG